MSQSQNPLRTPLIAIVFAALMLPGCNPGADERADEQASPTPSIASTPAAAAELPAPLIPESEKGEKGARNVLLAFARALENRQFATAYALLGATAGRGLSEADFTAMWTGLREISVAVVDGDVEGGAGSLYYTAGTTITSMDEEGRPIRFQGPIILRRVNDVDGASEAQLRWHLDSFGVVQVH